jgi:Tol biopolymer transport system component
MAVQPGARLGPYEVLGSLGTGGMGEVYRAHDAKLGRDVAIKVLPAGFNSHSDRLLRLEREARLLASLNHPNIAAIYGVEERDGILALVLELVEGESLADRLRRAGRSGLPLREALSLAVQICDALDAAHERGIVHRDLKPANVLIATGDVVKVLDFGLAKPGAVDTTAGTDDEPRRPAEALSHSPTVMAPTVDGVLLGTAPYMSPEQARGRTVDKRTDIWAFGCVLYEMLTGRRAFNGDTMSDVIAAILEREPDLAALPPATPPHVCRLIARCLEKDAKRRVRDIADARFELERGAESTIETRAAASRWKWLVPASIAAVALAAAAALRARDDLPPWAAEATVLSIEVTNGVLTPNGMPAVSADGRHVAWVTIPADGRPKVWVQSLATGTGRALDGTEGATYPFWSPDGASIGFAAQGQLKRIDLASGSIKSIATVPDVPIGAAWNAQNVIVFSARYGLYAVDASGAAPRQVAALDRSHQENSLRFPRFLPDGRHFLYVARSGRPQQSAVYVGSLDGKSQRLFPTTSSVAYASPGYLLYPRDGALVAQSFDTATFAVSSDTTTIVERVGLNAGGMAGNFDVSDKGVVVFLRTNPAAQATLIWTDRSGKELGALGAPDAYANFRISPDGSRVVFDRAGDAGARSVWVSDADGASVSRLTFAGSDEWVPAWSPDGQRVAFLSYRNGPGDIYVKSIATAQPDEPLLMSEDQKSPGDWSPDGKFLAYAADRAETRQDVWVVPVGSKGAPIPITRTAASESRPRFSPDGRWIAYESDETGRLEIYVQPFPPTGGKWQVSTQGGSDPAWRGRELFFMDGERNLIAVPVAATATTFSAGRPSTLFKLPPSGIGAQLAFDASPDGQKFLVRSRVDPPRQPVMVMLNWPARLKK